MKYRPDIEGLRAVAVILVVLSHLGVTGFRGGYVGVDVFFVISGYLITGLITSEYARKSVATEGGGWVSLRSFYFRRVKRIVPMSLFILVATTIASYLLFNPVRARAILSDSEWAALFGANIHFINIATDYFQQGFSASPIQHYWSLAVEEQFYFVVPTLFILATKIPNIRLFRYKFWWERRVKFLFSFIALASFFWSIVETSANSASAYFSSLTRAWELGAGAFLAISTHKGTLRFLNRLSPGLGILGLLLIGYSTVAFTSITNFPGYAALAPVLGAGLIIYSGISSSRFVSHILALKPFTSIGKISYSVYLWHWPLIVILNATHPNILKSSGGKFALLAGTLILATASYKLIEQPFRRIPIPNRWKSEKLTEWILQRIRRNGWKRTAGVAAAFLLVVTSVSLGVHFRNDFVSHPITAPNPSPTPSTNESTTGSYSTLLNTWNQKIFNSLLTLSAQNLNPSFTKTQSYDTWRNPDCNHIPKLLGVAEVKNLAICKEGTGSKVALFIGNSHGRMLQKAITVPFVKAGWTTYSFFMPWCMTPEINAIDKIFSKTYDCDLYHSDLQSLLTKMHPDVVIVSDRLFPKRAFTSGGKTYAANISEPTFWNIYQRSMKSVKSLTNTLIVIGMTPELPKPITECVDAQLNLQITCQSDGAGISEAVLSQSKAAISAQALFIDSRIWLCYQNIYCPAIIDNTLVYKDADHTSFPMESKFSLLFTAFLKQYKIIQ